MGNSLAAACSLYKAVFFTASHVRIRISTTSNVRIPIRYCKSAHWVWMCNEIRGLYDEINLWYFPIYIALVILVSHCWYWYLQKFSPTKVGGVASFGTTKVSNLRKFFSVFSQKFSPLKVSCYTVAIDFASGLTKWWLNIREMDIFHTKF